MDAPNSSTRNKVNRDVTRQPVVNGKFCLSSTTTFTVWKRPPVLSTVAGMVIKDSKGVQKFKMDELPHKEPGLAVKYVEGNPILTVKPEVKIMDKMLKFVGKNQWNVFRTMESVSPKPLFTVQTSSHYSKIEVSQTGYTIEGSKGIFKILHEVKIEGKPSIAAEVTLKDSVYTVKVMKGYDQAFIFGLVAVFEQIRLTKK